jgi:RimJ/RimL family protein N-acetyltransferase
MFHKLEPENYDRVQSLFAPFEHHLSLPSVISGNNRGSILVDNLEKPHVALALTMEGYLLSGDQGNTERLCDLQDLLQNQILTGELYVGSDKAMCLAVHPDSWESLLPVLIPTHEIEKLNRYVYICRQLAFDWRKAVPAGYALQPLNRELLTGTGPVAAHLAYWVDYRQGWESIDHFLDRGGGYCAIRDGQIVCWCSAEYHAGEQVDVGIVTHWTHRRRGLATAVAAATVEHMWEKGYRQVGWHCTDYNIGSWKTAEKVGFERSGRYTYYYYILDPIDHLVELGRHYSRLGEAERSLAFYQRAFEQRDQHPASTYHLVAVSWAMLGHPAKALAYLRSAVERGWSALEFTQQQAAFSLIRGTPEWKKVLERMEINRATEKS